MLRLLNLLQRSAFPTVRPFRNLLVFVFCFILNLNYVYNSIELKVTDKQLFVKETEVISYTCRHKFKKNASDISMTMNEKPAEEFATDKKWLTHFHQGSKFYMHITAYWTFHDVAIGCRSPESPGNYEVSNTIKLNVHFYPRVDPMTNVRQKEDTELLLRCNYKANPPVDDIKWYKNQKLLVQYSTYELGIPSLSLNNTGNYTCVIKNPMGTRSRSAMVTVYREWTQWSLWTICLENCTRIRTRECLLSACTGNSKKSADCTGNLCVSVEAKSEARQTYIVPIVIACVASFVIGISVVFLWKNYNKKPKNIDLTIDEIDDYIELDETDKLDENLKPTDPGYIEKLEKMKDDELAEKKNVDNPDEPPQHPDPKYVDKQEKMKDDDLNETKNKDDDQPLSDNQELSSASGINRGSQTVKRKDKKHKETKKKKEKK